VKAALEAASTELMAVLEKCGVPNQYAQLASETIRNAGEYIMTNSVSQLTDKLKLLVVKAKSTDVKAVSSMLTELCKDVLTPRTFITTSLAFLRQLLIATDATPAYSKVLDTVEQEVLVKDGETVNAVYQQVGLILTNPGEPKAMLEKLKDLAYLVLGVDHVNQMLAPVIMKVTAPLGKIQE